ncbi:MAG: hypothetical protein RR203_06035 [Synergistaceae bacterium]
MMSLFLSLISATSFIFFVFCLLIIYMYDNDLFYKSISTKNMPTSLERHRKKCTNYSCYIAFILLLSVFFMLPIGSLPSFVSICFTAIYIPVIIFTSGQIFIWARYGKSVFHYKNIKVYCICDAALFFLLTLYGCYMYERGISGKIISVESFVSINIWQETSVVAWVGIIAIAVSTLFFIGLKERILVEGNSCLEEDFCLNDTIYLSLNRLLNSFLFVILFIPLRPAFLLDFSGICLFACDAVFFVFIAYMLQKTVFRYITMMLQKYRYNLVCLTMLLLQLLGIILILIDLKFL